MHFFLQGIASPQGPGPGPYGPMGRSVCFFVVWMGRVGPMCFFVTVDPVGPVVGLVAVTAWLQQPNDISCMRFFNYDRTGLLRL